MELKDLAKMTVTKLREEAHKFEVKDTLGMSKEQLIDLLCEKHNIVRKKEIPKGIGRHALKEKIRKLHAARGEMAATGDRKKIHVYRRRLKTMRRKLRKVIEKAAHGKVKAAAGDDKGAAAS